MEGSTEMWRGALMAALKVDMLECVLVGLKVLQLVDWTASLKVVK